MLTPAAAAFGASFEINNEPLEPEVEQREGTLTIVATCAEVWERTPPTLANFLEVEVATSADHPELRISGPASVQLSTAECTAPTEDEIDATATYSLSATRAAPAFSDIGYRFDTTLEAGEFGENATAEHDDAIKVEFFPIFQMEVDAPIQIMEPDGDAEYTFTITNLANGEGVAKFSFSKPPPAGINVVLPQDTIIPYDPEGTENKATAVLALSQDPDADVPPLADFTIEVSFASVEDPAAVAEPRIQSLSLRIQDAKGAPAPTFLLAAPTLLAAALLARRRA